jgi:hypothetical protein
MELNVSAVEVRIAVLVDLDYALGDAIELNARLHPRESAERVLAREEHVAHDVAQVIVLEPGHAVHSLSATE